MVTPRSRTPYSEQDDGRSLTLEQLLIRPDWHSDAGCNEAPDAEWFPVGTTPRWKVDRALRICSDCKVRTECAEFAESQNMREGIWAGVNRAARHR